MFFINSAHVRGVLGKPLVFLFLIRVFTVWSSVTNLTDKIVTDLLSASEMKRSNNRKCEMGYVMNKLYDSHANFLYDKLLRLSCKFTLLNYVN